MTSTRLSGRSPRSMVSSFSRGCSDQADSSGAMDTFSGCQHPATNALSVILHKSRKPGGAACFPRHLAPNRDREIGGGRATRQPGQVRKEAALTRSGSGRSSVSYLFFERIAQMAVTTLRMISSRCVFRKSGHTVLRSEYAQVEFRKAGFER